MQLASMLSRGDPVLWRNLRTTGGRLYPLSVAAGRPVVLAYLASVRAGAAKEALAQLASAPIFDGESALLLPVVIDPAEEALVPSGPGVVPLFDPDRRFALQLGLVEPPRPGFPGALRPATFVLDPDLRVRVTIPWGDGAGHAAAVQAALPEAAPRPGAFPPILVLRDVLEPALCRALIAHYDASEPAPSGVVVHAPDGSGAIEVDRSRKVRRDAPIRDPDLLKAVHERMTRRVAPEVRRAFQFEVAHAERYVIGCYRADEGGWFSAHRDNQGSLTAHRQFAATINLNAEDYEGGDISFPEFSPTRFRGPTGGIVVFSCSLLHAVDPVTRGRRLAIIPFLFDAAGLARRVDPEGPQGPPAPGSTGAR